MNGSVSSGRPDQIGQRGTRLLIVFVLIGAVVSLSLGVYGRVHPPTGRAITTFGLPSLIGMKVTLSTVALGLGSLQVITALRMYGRIGHGPPRPATATLHRICGVSAVVVSAPVAFHCLWSLGFGAYSTRVVVHSVMGCLFYGIFVTKMLTLRSRRIPGWALPWLGGLLFTALAVAWFTSSVWFLTRGSTAYGS